MESDLHPMVKFSSRTLPGLPMLKVFFTRKTLKRSFSYSNHAPGFGLKPCILPITLLASKFQLIFVSVLSIFFA